MHVKYYFLVNVKDSAIKLVFYFVSILFAIFLHYKSYGADDILIDRLVPNAKLFEAVFLLFIFITSLSRSLGGKLKGLKKHAYSATKDLLIFFYAVFFVFVFLVVIYGVYGEVGLLKLIVLLFFVFFIFFAVEYIDADVKRAGLIEPKAQAPAVIALAITSYMIGYKVIG